MIKLFVDDLRPEPKGWHRATTIDEAIRILASGMVDEISIDHDISCQIKEAKPDEGEVPYHPSPETYFPIARYLALMLKDQRPKIRIHTSNFVKGREMAELLGLPYNNYLYKQEDYE